MDNWIGLDEAVREVVREIPRQTVIIIVTVETAGQFQGGDRLHLAGNDDPIALGFANSNAANSGR